MSVNIDPFLLTITFILADFTKQLNKLVELKLGHSNPYKILSNILLFLHAPLWPNMGYFPVHVGSLLFGHKWVVSLLHPEVFEGIDFRGAQLQDIPLIQPMDKLRS